MRLRKRGEHFFLIGIFAYFYDPNVSPNTSCGSLHIAPSHVSNVNVRIKQVTDNLASWDNLVYKLQTLSFEITTEDGYAGDIATRVIEAGNVSKPYGIVPERSDDRNCFGRSDDSNVGAARPDQDGWPAANKISGEFRKTIDVAIRPPIFDRDVLTLNKSSLIQALRERGNEMGKARGGLSVQKDDQRRLLLRARYERPCRHNASNPDEFAPPHRISRA
jgi:hypothetical protein